MDKKFEMVIVADYITEISHISEKELYNILPVINAIRELTEQNKNTLNFHNWPDNEYLDDSYRELYPQLTEEQLETFQEYLPFGEFGIHTIQSIVYYEIPEKIKLL